MADEERKENNENIESNDDVVEFEYNEDGEEDLKKTLKKLRADLKQAQKEKEEYLTGWQKERADFANYKKDEEARRANYSEVVRERILSRFITIMDSFNIAFSNKEAWEKVDLNWRLGIQHIYSQLTAIFEEYGIKPFGSVGESFDPNLHNSLDVVPTEDKEKEHTIASVIQKGYKLGDRIIRPAGVNVYEFRNNNGE